MAVNEIVAIDDIDPRDVYDDYEGADQSVDFSSPCVNHFTPTLRRLLAFAGGTM